MSIAQKLYENGLITYMRTDSTEMSQDFKELLKRSITSRFGEEYYKSSVKKKVKEHKISRMYQTNRIR